MKSGRKYKILAEARYEATLNKAIVYQSLDDGSVWVRPFEEFHDGRFQ